MMSFLLSRSHSVPLDHDASARLLPWLIGLMVFLASLAMVVAFSMTKLADRWDNALSRGVTIQIPSGTTQTEREFNRAQVDKLTKRLEKTDGVSAVSALGDAELEQMLAPWLGTEILIQDLPVPFLIAVELDSIKGPLVDRLRQVVSTTVASATIDDHQRWMDSLLNLAKTIKLIAVLTVFLVTGAAVIMVILVTRMSLAIHVQLVELLHQMGAYDSFIAFRFQQHALRLSLLGGGLGLLMTGITVAIMGYFMAQANTALLPQLTLHTGEWFVLIVFAVSAGLIAMITARVTVLRFLHKMP